MIIWGRNSLNDLFTNRTIDQIFAQNFTFWFLWTLLSEGGGGMGNVIAPKYKPMEKEAKKKHLFRFQCPLTEHLRQKIFRDKKYPKYLPKICPTTDNVNMHIRGIYFLLYYLFYLLKEKKKSLSFPVFFTAFFI